MKARNLIPFIASILLVMIACKKNDIGGDATVTANVKHHEKPINLPTIYVKFGTLDLPSDPTNNYDLKLEGKHENHIHVKELRYGKYYFYATGFDSSIMLPVSGGLPVEIKWSERKKEKIVEMGVTE